MGLLTEVMTRLSAPRLCTLTNADNPGGLKTTQVAGTVAVTNGSAAVVGTGTNFTSFGVNQIIQFSSQPGVNYVVSVITDATHMTLLQAYTGTTAASPNAFFPAINYVTLQQAVYDAQTRFQAVTNYPFDDTTQNANTSPLTLNKCIWAGIALVVAYLYDYRGLPGEAAETAAAWKKADHQLDIVLHTYGDGAFAAPVTDSVFVPSTGPSRAPDFDTQRFGDIDQFNPGPATGTAGGSGTQEY